MPIEIDNFAEKYIALKERGLNDFLIAKEFFVSPNTIVRMKKRHGISGFSFHGSFRLTDEQMEIAKSNGLDLKRVKFRVCYQEWDIEKAITTPHRNAKKRRIKLTVDQERIAASNGLDFRTVSARIRKCGWPVEKAISVPKISKRENAIRVNEAKRKNG